MSIKEISRAGGFASEGSFYNAFKKIFGCGHKPIMATWISSFILARFCPFF